MDAIGPWPRINSDCCSLCRYGNQPNDRGYIFARRHKTKLLIMNAEGNLKNAYAFDKKLLPQPEALLIVLTASFIFQARARKMPRRPLAKGN